MIRINSGDSFFTCEMKLDPTGKVRGAIVINSDLNFAELHVEGEKAGLANTFLTIEQCDELQKALHQLVSKAKNKKMAQPLKSKP